MIIGIVGHFGRFWVHWGLPVRPVQGGPDRPPWTGRTGSPCIVYALGLAYVQEEKIFSCQKNQARPPPPRPG